MASEMKSRLTLIMVFCLTLGGALISRAAFIQLAQNPKLEAMARRQFQAKVLIRPRRGAILDRNGEPLAINTEISSLAANPSKISNKRNLARLLARSTDIPYAKLLQRLEDKKEFIWIKRHLSEHELDRLRKWHVMASDGDMINGLWLVKESQRVYPHRELAAHVLGDVNVDSEGLEGIELQMNEQLRGKVVSISAIKDALGRPTFIDAEAAKNVQDGESATLTLDASLQFSVEEELQNAVRKFGARGGTVIVMNAMNGEILALANQPAFNPNDKTIPIDHRRNRAFTDGYEPGSTMKPILLASALSHGWKLSDSIWAEEGQFKVQGKKISEAEAHEKFGWITLKKVIQVSSNVGAAKIALKLGTEHYYNTLQAFGFASKTGSGFPGEIAGRIPPRATSGPAWQPLTLANVGFGQGLLTTRLQIARAYATFLNGGWLVQPTLLKTKAESLPGPSMEPSRRILSQRVCDQVIDALETAVGEDGTGVKAALPGYRVAGKTGTAQVVDPTTGSYSRSKYIASFVGFPLDVDRKIVVFASIDEPHGVYYATDTAAPLFREVLSAVANRFSLPAKTVITQADQLATSQAKTAPLQPVIPAISPPPLAIHWQGTTPEGDLKWSMPSLHGLTPREAIAQLKGHPFRLEIRGAGLVHSQFPAEGETIAEGGTVRLLLMEP